MIVFVVLETEVETMVLVFSWTQEHLDSVLIQTWPSARLGLNPLLVLNQTLPFSGLRLDSDLTRS